MGWYIIGPITADERQNWQFEIDDRDPIHGEDFKYIIEIYQSKNGELVSNETVTLNPNTIAYANLF